MSPTFDSEASADAIRLARWRIMPAILLMYMVNFLDRANIGFAQEALQISAGVSATAYAFGAGLFFLTYAAFEIPSNIIMHRVGARWWLARIMVTWGLVSAATMFTSNTTSFYVLRAMLGAAEAGFAPGIFLYLTYWFPRRYLASAIGVFYFAPCLALAFGSPLSGLLLNLNGFAGLAGWQWMFLIEGLLSSAVGVLVFFYLDDKPENAMWLPARNRRALVEEIASEERQKLGAGPAHVTSVLCSPRVLHFVVIYFLIQVSVYGVIFYLPNQVAALLGRRVGLEVGFVAAVPWLFALVAAWLLPLLAGLFGHHRGIAFAALVAAGLGIAVSAFSPPLVAVAALCVAAAGFIGMQPLFWTFPTSYLGGVAAAGGIAMINAIGTLGGFFGPNIRQWADLAFASRNAGLYALAVSALLGALGILLIDRESPSRARRPGASGL